MIYFFSCKKRQNLLTTLSWLEVLQDRQNLSDRGNDDDLRDGRSCQVLKLPIFYFLLAVELMASQLVGWSTSFVM